MRLSLNSKYAIRNFKNCSFILAKRTVIDDKGDGLISPIPPFIGYILSEIINGELETQLNIISQKLKIRIDSIRTFINNILNIQEDGALFKFNDNLSSKIPYDILLKNDTLIKPDIYFDEDFRADDDFIVSRPSSPFSVNFMITNKCTANCIYCYADRSMSPELNTEQIINILNKCKKDGVVNMTITGGDLFARNDWKEVLSKFIELNFSSFISTKTPLSNDDLKFLKDLGIKELQFSLDSTQPYELTKIINVSNNYIKQVEDMLYYCDSLGINIQIRTVLTRFNGSLDSQKRLNSFISKHQCIKEHDITPAFFPSSPDRNYDNFKIDNNQLISIYNYYSSISTNHKIIFNKLSKEGYTLQRFATTEEFVKRNQICQANTFALSILANGNCSLCEMCYKSCEYIFGNILNNSVKEIWNSKLSLKHFHPIQSDLPEETPCKDCAVFSECKQGFKKRICYSDILKIYGSGKSHMPDPRCPHARKTDLIL